MAHPIGPGKADGTPRFGRGAWNEVVKKQQQGGATPGPNKGAASSRERDPGVSGRRHRGAGGGGGRGEKPRGPGSRDPVQPQHAATASGTVSKWHDEVRVKKAPVPSGELPDHYKERDYNNMYVVPQTEEEWIKSIGGLMSSTNDFRDIKKKLKERADYYVHKYFTRFSVQEVYKHALAILLHHLIRRDNEKLMQDVFNEVKRTHPDYEEYLVNSVFNCYTPLDACAFHGACNCFQLLLVLGARADAVNYNGETLEDTIEAGMAFLQKRNPTLFNEKRRGFEVCKDYIKRWRERQAGHAVGFRAKMMAKYAGASEATVAAQLPTYDSIDCFVQFLNDEFEVEALLAHVRSLASEQVPDLLLEWLLRAVETSPSKENYERWAQLMRELFKGRLVSKAQLEAVAGHEDLAYYEEDYPFLKSGLGQLISSL